MALESAFSGKPHAGGTMPQAHIPTSAQGARELDRLYLVQALRGLVQRASVSYEKSDRA